MSLSRIQHLKKAKLAIVFAFFVFTNILAQKMTPITGANSPYDEIHPVLSPSGDLYFTRAFHPENTPGSANLGDIWVSKMRASGEYQVASRNQELSLDGMDAVLGFSQSDELYVYHGIHRYSPGIYLYRWVDGSWGDSKRVEIPGFRPTGQQVTGRLSTDGSTLVLSMESFDSYGNEDLYITRKTKSGAWSRLLHLGPEVNTAYQELTPFLSADQRVLYFSSNGHGEKSLQKIYFSIRLDDSFVRWTDPSPVAQLQTFGVTLSYFTDSGNGTSYLTSTSSSEGYGDIFQIGDGLQALIDEQLEANLLLAIGQATEVGSQPVQQQLFEKDTMVVANEEEPINKEQRDVMPKNLPDGVSLKQRIGQVYPNFQLLVMGGGRIANLGIDSPSSQFQGDLSQAVLLVEGYLPGKLKNTGSEWDMPNLIPAQTGNRLILDNIQFQRGGVRFLDSESAEAVEVITIFLTQNPTLKISLEGHTDSFGNVELNKKLSLDRASSIRDQLVANGIAFDRIRVAGYGGSKPLADNQSEEGRTLNRRVEMVILED
ncbi:OmpA family protein [Lunatimonas salinarum]|uniref:OmpA family protein n=1 Tax=Lunatimonas salinarum TaxID=1774590 RepID=UPI001AE05314|nr:OmpA family protein [Lunatimonas salinarum]